MAIIYLTYFMACCSLLSSTRDGGSKCIVTGYALEYVVQIVGFKAAVVSNPNRGTPKTGPISFVKMSEFHGMLLTAQLHERWRKQVHCDRLCFRVSGSHCGV